MAATAAVGAVGASALTATPASAQTGLTPMLLPVGPFRVWDSRKHGTKAPIRSGQTVTLTGGVQPDDYAQLFNVTVTGTSKTGYLAVYSADDPYNGTSSINWYGPGQTLCNNAYTAFRLADGGINVRCDGGGATHFILDLVGVLTFLDLGAAVTARSLTATTTSPLRGGARSAANSLRRSEP